MKKQQENIEINHVNKKEKGTFIKIVVSLVFALIIFIVLINVEKSMMKNYEKTKVVVCKKNIEKQMEITKDNVNNYFELIEVPSNIVPDTAIKKIEDVNFGITLTNISKKEILRKDDIVSNDKLVKDIKNPVITSISIKTLDKAVGGVLRKGDIVNISLVREDNDKTLLLKKVYILEAMNSSGEILSKDSVGAATIFNIVVDKKDAQKLKEVVDENKELTLVKVNDIMY